MNANKYYTEKLSATHLKRCYTLAPLRVKQYLQTEIEHVIQKIQPQDRILELGCGYGRVLNRLAEKAGFAIGIDTSYDSLLFGRETFTSISSCCWLQMDAVRLGFPDSVFDRVICIQNGISAFHRDQKALIKESVRVAKSGGIVLFSSYSERFWEVRLEWFRLQSKAGLLGRIDEEKTGNGVIVCEDGFKATTVGAEEFLSMTSGMDATTAIEEVDGSSLFCEMIKNK